MSPLSRHLFRGSQARSSAHVIIVSIALAGSLLAACGKKDLPEQTIVTGDKFEITLPELEQVLRAAPPVRREEVAPARRALLDALIGEKLLAEAADKDALGERPDVVQQLAAARRVILANAYVSKIGNGDEKISEADISRYYEANPAMFKDRVVFTVEEFALPLSNPDILSYTQLLDDRGFDALRASVAQRLPEIALGTRKLASSDLPAAASRAATQLKSGGNVSYRTVSALHLGRIVAVQPAPIAPNEARDAIVATLAQQRRLALTKAAVDDLRRSRHVRIVNADLSRLVAK